MSEKLTEYVTRPFDAMLAEDLSQMIHESSTDCRHDIGIMAAQIAHAHYKGAGYIDEDYEDDTFAEMEAEQ